MYSNLGGRLRARDAACSLRSLRVSWRRACGGWHVIRPWAGDRTQRLQMCDAASEPSPLPTQLHPQAIERQRTIARLPFQPAQYLIVHGVESIIDCEVSERLGLNQPVCRPLLLGILDFKHDSGPGAQLQVL